MRNRALFILACFLALSPRWGGASSAATGGEIVASVNGEGISVRDLREALGLAGGGVQASWIPVEKKKDARERLIVGRLLEQSARRKGIDNTVEFLGAMERNEPGIPVNALLRQEAASRVAVTKGEVREEAGKLRGKDKGLSAAEARDRASATVWERNFRRFQEELVAEAREGASATVDEEAIRRIESAGPLEDNTVLGTAGGEPVRYGDVKQVLGRMSVGKHDGGDLARNPAAVRKLVDRELTARSLLFYARKQVAGDSEWSRTVRAEAERTFLVNRLTETVILKEVAVSDREIRDAYARHSWMLVRDGKPIPLSEVKENIRGILLAEKKKAAIDRYVAPLRKKAKIRTNEKLLPKV